MRLTKNDFDFCYSSNSRLAISASRQLYPCFKSPQAWEKYSSDPISPSIASTVPDFHQICPPKFHPHGNTRRKSSRYCCHPHHASDHGLSLRTWTLRFRYQGPNTTAVQIWICWSGTLKCEEEHNGGMTYPQLFTSRCANAVASFATLFTLSMKNLSNITVLCLVSGQCLTRSVYSFKILPRTRGSILFTPHP